MTNTAKMIAAASIDVSMRYRADRRLKMRSYSTLPSFIEAQAVKKRPGEAALLRVIISENRREDQRACAIDKSAVPREQPARIFYPCRALECRAGQIAELRQQLQEAEQKDAHRGNRVTDLLTRMREDIARGDFAAADSDLNAAERVNIQDPAIREARRELARARDAKEKDERK